MDTISIIFAVTGFLILVGVAVAAIRNNQQQECIMKTLDEVLDEVKALRTVADGLAALTKNIKERLDAVLAGALTPEQQAKVDAIFAEVEAEKSEIAQVITENTPSEP